MRYERPNTQYTGVYPRVLLTWREQGKSYFLGLQQGTPLPQPSKRSTIVENVRQIHLYLKKQTQLSPF